MIEERVEDGSRLKLNWIPYNDDASFVIRDILLISYSLLFVLFCLPVFEYIRCWYALELSFAFFSSLVVKKSVGFVLKESERKPNYSTMLVSSDLLNLLVFLMIKNEYMNMETCVSFLVSFFWNHILIHKCVFLVACLRGFSLLVCPPCPLSCLSMYRIFTLHVFAPVFRFPFASLKFSYISCTERGGNQCWRFWYGCFREFSLSGFIIYFSYPPFPTRGFLK